MSAKPPLASEPSNAQLRALGEQLRARRKALRVSGTAAAESAGMSRVTLHRIEKGEPSVTMGAWANAMAALGMALQTVQADGPRDAATAAAPPDWASCIPVKIRLADYPQLQVLAWQVQGTDTLRPMEALGIYERNARHLNLANMSEKEQALLQALRTGLGGATLVKEGGSRGV